MLLLMQPRVGSPRPLRPRSGGRTEATCALSLCLALTGCTLAPGEAVAAARDPSDEIRIGVPSVPASFDPALAASDVERVVARALFATLTRLAPDGTPGPGLAAHWAWNEQQHTLRLVLDDKARFSDGAPVTAHDVVWSWQRALRATTRAADKSPFDVFADGRDLVEGLLLRAAEGGALEPTPYSVFAPGAAPAPATLAEQVEPGARVRVLDSNARRPCCGEDVPLLVSTSDGDQAVASLSASDIARVLAARVVDGSTWLRLRDPHGRAGWARAAAVSVVVPPVAVRRVVDRGEGSLALRAGPDPDAPIRGALVDDDTIELLEPGPEFSLVLDARSGRAAFLRSDVIDEVLGERWWLEVVDVTRAAARGWMRADALAFDASALRARAVDDVTLDLDIAPTASLDATLRALATPLLAPVPARLVDEHGNAWASPTHIATSGPFVLGTVSTDALHLLRRSGVAPTRVLLIAERDPTAALHAYRAGALDMLMDGMLAPELLPTLRRASDFADGPRGGMLCNPAIAGFVPEALDPGALAFVAERAP